MKKRLAIQLFGHIRTFLEASPLFLKNVVSANLASGYDIDVFIHTWDEVDHNTVNYRIDGKDTSEIQKTDKDMLYKAYGDFVRGICIEKQLEIEEQIVVEKASGCNRSVKGIYNNACTTFKANEIRRKYEKEYNIQYDFVIQTRPDILFLSSFRVDDFFAFHQKRRIPTDEKALYFAHNIFNGGEIKLADPHIMTGTDLIYFASPDVMNVATSLFENFDKNFDANNFWSMEIWWMDFWKKSGLHPIAADFQFRRDWLVLYGNMVRQLPEILDGHNKLAEKKMEGNMEKIYVKLFGFIPLFKIKRKESGYKVYLFNFIPLFKIKR